MASGLGEMMERFQNGRFFSRNPYRRCVYPSYETTVSPRIQRMNDGWFEALRQKCGSVPQPELVERYFKYRDLDTGSEVWVVEELNTQSTGEAAGNTYEEAFVQGFAEIAERYSAFHVLAGRKPLPDIPGSALSGNTRKLISVIEDKGIAVRIKDASLGLPLTTVALLFEYDRYDAGELGIFTGCGICFGSASSLDVAVERCITESYEGYYDVKIRFHINRLHGMLTRALYAHFPQLASHVPYTDFCAEYYPTEDFFPVNGLDFLREDAGRPSFREYTQSDCLDEVNHILDLLHSRGWSIYMKDANWLGFPAMKIFVPEMNCPVLSAHYAGRNTVIRAFLQRVLTQLDRITPRDLILLEDPAFLLYLIVKKNMSAVLGIETNVLDRFSAWKFFGLLSLAYGNESTARRYLSIYSFFSHGDRQELKAYHENPRSILPSLSRAIPDCRLSCDQCLFSRSCRHPVKKALEDYVLEHFQEHFRVFP